jgi:lipopolysaccharide assembly outer membrane protein LptD (OstA)
MGEVGGNALATFTLPAATGTGNIYKFIVSVVNTSNYVIKVPDSSHTFSGSVNILDIDGTAQAAFPAIVNSDTITLNGTTQGGAAIGNFIEIIDILSDKFMVFGQLTCSSSTNPVTPFSATV